MVYTVVINGVRYYQVSDVCREIGVSSLSYVLAKHSIKPLTVQGGNNRPVRMITANELIDVMSHYDNDAKRKAAIKRILDGECVKFNENVTELNHPEFGGLRTICRGDKTLYCAADLARILGFTGLPSVLSYCHYGEKCTIQINERAVDMTFICESDAKRVINAGKIGRNDDVMAWLFPAKDATVEDDVVTSPDCQVFSDPVFGNIRTIERDNKVLFCGKDVATALGYSNPRDAINRHCKGVVKHDGVSTNTNRYGTTTEQVVEMAFITEGDVYRLIVRSRLAEAERFERWLFDEVVPKIRKHGMYATDELLNNPELAIQVFQALKEERDRNRELAEANRNLQVANQALVHETRSWNDRSVLNALIRKYTSVTSGNFQLGWNIFYKELAYKKNIQLRLRKGNCGVIDKLRGSEWSDAIEVAVAMCEAVGLNVAEIINEVNAERVCG